ncbi:hypothetical protein V5O48_000406 [Marasmius crinis-equi]|uniref:ABM domain-containing protein n=1 Tax=Marasmius crinis-equi TaxID=585013 RepID=A0ABR3G167_9AGAR
MRLLIPLALLGAATAVELQTVRRDLPQDYTGKFLLFVQGDAVDGRAEELQQLLQAVRESVKKEPGILTYRIARGFDEQNNRFATVEEYLNPEAFAAHQSTEAYQNLINSGAIDASSTFSQFFAKEF